MFMNLSVMSVKFIENATSKEKSREVRPTASARSATLQRNGCHAGRVVTCGRGRARVYAQPMANERIEISAKRLICIYNDLNYRWHSRVAPVQGMHWKSQYLDGFINLFHREMTRSRLSLFNHQNKGVFQTCLLWTGFGQSPRPLFLQNKSRSYNVSMEA